MKKSLKPLFLSTTLGLAMVSNQAFASDVLEAAKEELAPVAPVAVTAATPGWFNWMWSGKTTAIKVDEAITVEVKDAPVVAQTLDSNPAPAPEAIENTQPSAPKKILYPLPDDAPVTESVLFLPTEVVQKGWFFNSTQTVEKKFKVKKPVEDISASELQGVQNLALLAHVETLIPDESSQEGPEASALKPAQDTPVDVPQARPDSPVTSLSDDEEDVRPLFESANDIQVPASFKEYSSTPSASDAEDESDEYNYDYENYEADVTQGSADMELDSGHEGQGFSLAASNGDGLFGGEGLTDSNLIATVLLQSPITSPSRTIKENWDDPDSESSADDSLGLDSIFSESKKSSQPLSAGSAKKTTTLLSTSPKELVWGSVIQQIKERHQQWASVELMQQAKQGKLLAPIAEAVPIKMKRSLLLDLFDL